MRIQGIPASLLYHHEPTAERKIKTRHDSEDALVNELLTVDGLGHSLNGKCWHYLAVAKIFTVYADICKVLCLTVSEKKTETIRITAVDKNPGGPAIISVGQEYVQTDAQFTSDTPAPRPHTSACRLAGDASLAGSTLAFNDATIRPMQRPA